MGAIQEIHAERRRQIESEGWTPEHDDQHRDKSLYLAGMAYFAHALAGQRLVVGWGGQDISIDLYRQSDPVPAWPWLRKWWKPKDPRRDAIRAGALILAEKARLLRREPQAYVGHLDHFVRQIARFIRKLDKWIAAHPQKDAPLVKAAIHAVETMDTNSTSSEHLIGILTVGNGSAWAIPPEKESGQ